jgi:hypothetical protein
MVGRIDVMLITFWTDADRKCRDQRASVSQFISAASCERFNENRIFVTIITAGEQPRL